ncbi:fluoride efflux transporter CrcB [Phenylobacterium sp. J367]|uniref:fluoride efflux transporter CrcB n=1 Tax=Phenylobacterium sp. J367 TaxID=2898435 RepID=UPI0021510818|nr:fluoride efflux transporter CrcB [Phenylobacterium sp. J367]MCR5880738.1 fluoride efflux transporter CrcB [Phenylobacterium sp. J367]
MQTLLYVGLGGAFGAILRYLVGVQATRALGPGWPVGTFTVNIVGGLLMGLLVGVLAHRGDVDQERWRLLIGVGVLGGFTTFSAFSLDLALMLERRAFATAALYAIGSVVLATGALFAGLMAARRFLA